MSPRPSLVCPRCGGVDGHPVQVDGVVVVRQCTCGHRFEVAPPEQLSEFEARLVATIDPRYRYEFLLGVLTMSIQIAVAAGDLDYLAGRLVEVRRVMAATAPWLIEVVA